MGKKDDSPTEGPTRCVLAFLPTQMDTSSALTSASHAGASKPLSRARGPQSERGTMTVLVSETKARCLENRRLVAGSRLLIARGRRLLNPAFEISGGSDDNLRRTIRTRLATGALFPVDGKVPAGKAEGKLCTICRMTMPQAELEYDVSSQTSVFLN